MRNRKQVQNIVLDENYVQTIFNRIVESVQTLDKLTLAFKEKQEQHFLKTFMNVVSKMGKDLMMAQQAYLNIDKEVKKDQYCLQLAEKLHFFRNQCKYLKDSTKTLKEQISELKKKEMGIEKEIEAIREGYEKKIKELMKSKLQNKELKKINILLQSKISNFKNTTKNPQKLINESSQPELELFKATVTTQRRTQTPNIFFYTNAKFRETSSSLRKNRQMETTGMSFRVRNNQLSSKTKIDNQSRI